MGGTGLIFGLLGVLAGSVAASGCGSGPLAPEQRASSGLVLGHLQSRALRVTIYASDRTAGAGAPRFDIRTLDSKLVAAGLDVEQLRERHPDLFDSYQKSLAGRSLDARDDHGPGRAAPFDAPSPLDPGRFGADGRR